MISSFVTSSALDKDRQTGRFNKTTLTGSELPNFDILFGPAGTNNWVDMPAGNRRGWERLGQKLAWRRHAFKEPAAENSRAWNQMRVSRERVQGTEI